MRFRTALALALLTGLALVPVLRAAEPDLSDPRKTVLSNAAAGKANDITALQACYYVSDAAKDPMRVYVNYIRAYMSLRKNAVAKFGPDADSVFRSPTFSATEEKLTRALDAGRLNYTDHGNRASLTVKIATDPNAVIIPDTTIMFQKVGDKWLIDAANMFGADKAATDPKAATELKKNVAYLGALAGAVAETADAPR